MQTMVYELFCHLQYIQDEMDETQMYSIPLASVTPCDEKSSIHQAAHNHLGSYRHRSLYLQKVQL